MLRRLGKQSYRTHFIKEELGFLSPKYLCKGLTNLKLGSRKPLKDIHQQWARARRQWQLPEIKFSIL